MELRGDTSILTANPVLWSSSDDSVRFDEEIGYEFSGSGRLDYHGDPGAVVARIQETREFTVEVWCHPENLKQDGPARLFTFSRNTSERNLTVGQEGDHFEVRLRTTKTSGNGLPGIKTKRGTAKRELTHVAFTFTKNGEARIFLNGKEEARKTIAGDFSNWDSNHQIALGDEISGGRNWRGSVAAFSLHDRAFSESELRAWFEAGPTIPEDLKATPERERPELSRNEMLFETRVTTILTQHCLECHDSSTAEGDLDLSKKLPSHLEDGILVAGKGKDSLLWESIENDDMPHDRPPLSDEEKAILVQWMDEGASWTTEFVDPAIYSRPAEVAPPRSARLTVTEYINSVRDLFGVDVEKEAREWIPADVRADGFSNTSYNLTVDLAHVEAFSKLAELIARELDAAAFAKRFYNKRDLTDKSMIALIEAMGLAVLRGPLEKEETAQYRGISTSVASAGGDFDEAIRYVVEAMVQSPRFLYRLESPRGKKRSRISDFELASRMSYLLLGSGPDRELLRLAEGRRLHSEVILSQQTARLLRDDRAVDRSVDFVSDWLHLDRLSHMQPSPEKFPDWDSSLASAMREETIRYWNEVVWEKKRPLSRLLNADFSYLSPALAKHYGISLSGADDVLQRVDLKDHPERGGILTQGSILTVGGDEASMVTRGLFVLDDLLRGVIKDPPPCVSTVPVPSEPGKTQRMIAMERVASSDCGGCHSKFEPLAYGLEKFDGLGTFHEKDEHGNALRDDGAVLFPGDAEPVAYDTVSQLMDILAESDRVKETITWKLVQFAMGRPLNARDAGFVSEIHVEAIRGGGTYSAVMEAIVKSELFRYHPAQ